MTEYRWNGTGAWMIAELGVTFHHKGDVQTLPELDELTPPVRQKVEDMLTIGNLTDLEAVLEPVPAEEESAVSGFFEGKTYKELMASLDVIPVELISEAIEYEKNHKNRKSVIAALEQRTQM